jgi:hypothetical protein
MENAPVAFVAKASGPCRGRVLGRSGEKVIAITFFDARQFGLQMSAAAMDGGIKIIAAVGLVHARKNSLKGVIIALRNRIELVIMAARTLHRAAGEGLHHGGDDVIAIQVTANLAVNRIFANVAQRALVPRACGQKSERDDGFGCIRVERVPGHLLFDKSCIGLIRIKRADEVIAIRPGVFADPILIVAVRLGKMRDIHPVARPALAITRGGQQAIHEPFVGVWRGVAFKVLDLFRSGRQAEEIEVQATN